ncbi:MAG TPA: putative metal-binding motif-containing protein [Polyangiaceae bacterium]
MHALRSGMVVVLGLVLACSSTGNGFGNENGDGGVDAGGDATTGPIGDGGNPFGNLEGGDATQVATCQYNDSTDHDGDGFSGTEGDCNDCDPNINPGAFDVPGNGVDEDCSGKADDEPTGCDKGLAIDSTNAGDGAKAIDLCRTTTANATGKARTWGVISAAYVLPDGKTSNAATFAAGHGILTAFGKDPKKPANSKPQFGSSMLGLSSGTARAPTDPGYIDVGGDDKGYTSGSPPPYPKNTPACPGVITGTPHDGAALSLQIRVPTNANSFTLQSAFFTYEWPGFICSTFNDSFVVMMTPKPANLADGNIVFDQDGNPVSVNNSFLQVCGCTGGPPCSAGGKSFKCPQGDSMLTATGFGLDTAFEDHGSTGWLTTTVPVDTLRGQTITLLFAIWDSGDGVLDSTALMDNFQWSVNAATSVSTNPNPPN